MTKRESNTNDWSGPWSCSEEVMPKLAFNVTELLPSSVRVSLAISNPRYGVIACGFGTANIGSDVTYGIVHVYYT